jgi:type VI secretion system secreted protein Hcp
MSEKKSKPGIASLIGRPLLAGAVAAGAALPTTAGADIFLDLEGIDGESQDSKHKNEIDILSYTQSFRRAASTGAGGQTGGKVNIGDITVLKNIDKSSPKLIEAVATGKHIPKATITFRSVGEKAPEYYVVTLTDVLITAVDQTDQPDPAKIVERVQLNATKFEYEYREQKADGSLGAPIKFGYDIKANQKF